jgi:undecaprenyl-diphosphatase
MDFIQAAKAIFLGLLEGATEFIPVSSTGHLILAEHFLQLQIPGKTFEVLVQLGAVLAILSVYAARLWDMAKRSLSDAAVQRFFIGVLIAFLPAALIGAVMHSTIKSVLFNPYLVCCTLIGGGIILWMVDRLRLEPRYTDATEFSLLMYLKIGFFQCLAMIPGVSRSGATIVGALLMGANKRAATEFSFFLAMPTMAGAFTYDLYKNYKLLSFSDGALIVIGFLAAFIGGLFVVRYLLDYVAQHGFKLFAVWRIIVGVVVLIALTILG